MRKDLQRVALGAILILLMLVAVRLFMYPPSSSAAAWDDFIAGSVEALPANTWVQIHSETRADWRRQGHAGATYDSRRGTILVFGSDTHGLDWDNTVREFDPRTRQWTTHYPEAPPSSYRADPQGRAIAGTDRLLPWAMHVYDNIVYDPSLDALVVTALPQHNPIRRDIREATEHPTWIYSLAERQWHILENSNEPSPVFFAAGSAYDPDRDVVAAYRSGMWELGPERDRWLRATGERHHNLHYTVEYDRRHRVFAVFGDRGLTNDVWIYAPGPTAGSEGRWKKRSPQGDYCPPGQHFPVAFSDRHGAFLLVVDDVIAARDGEGRERLEPTGSAVTCVYDHGANRYTRLPDARLERLGMNYMMAYDHFHDVFLLVAGNRQPTVWALRLDRTELGEPRV